MPVCVCVCAIAKGNSCLNPEEMGQLVILRMNRAFMQYMRQKHGRVQKLEDLPALGGMELDLVAGVDPSVISQEELASATLVRVVV